MLRGDPIIHNWSQTPPATAAVCVFTSLRLYSHLPYDKKNPSFICGATLFYHHDSEIQFSKYSWRWCSQGKEQITAHYNLNVTPPNQWNPERVNVRLPYFLDLLQRKPRHRENVQTQTAPPDQGLNPGHFCWGKTASQVLLCPFKKNTKIKHDLHVIQQWTTRFSV